MPHRLVLPSLAPQTAVRPVHFMWRVATWVCLLPGLTWIDPAPHVAHAESPVFTVKRRSGPPSTGLLRGDSSQNLRISSPGAKSDLRLSDVVSLENSRGAMVYSLQGNPRQLVLLGAESFPAGNPQFTNDRLLCVPFGGTPVTIPLGVIGLVRQPTGEFERQFHDADSEPLDSQAPPSEVSLDRSDARSWSGKYSFSLPPGVDASILKSRFSSPAGGIAMMWYDPGESGADADVRFKIQFGTGDSVRFLTISIPTGGKPISGSASEQWALEFQPVERRLGWRQIRLLYSSQRTVLLVDQRVLASGPAPGAPFADLRAESRLNSGVSQDGPVAWIDDLSEFESWAATPVPRFPASHDTLWLDSDDELVTPLFDQTESRKNSVIEVDWMNVRGVLPKRRRCPPSDSVVGWIAAVELAPRLGELVDAGTTIVAAIRSADDTHVSLAHPWLGKLSIPWDFVQKITPMYQGHLQVLDASPHHLGNNTKPGWQVALPEGTNWNCEFNLAALPADGSRAFLGLSVVDLEPFGGAFRMQGKQLEELRRGGLRTAVWVNDRNLGDLNSLLDEPAPVRSPRRLRIPIPAGVLGAGKNEVRFIQAPSTTNAREFDDWEMSRLTLEFEE